MRHAHVGLAPEDPLEAMKRLGELARKLDEMKQSAAPLRRDNSN